MLATNRHPAPPRGPGVVFLTTSPAKCDPVFCNGIFGGTACRCGRLGVQAGSPDGVSAVRTCFVGKAYPRKPTMRVIPLACAVLCVVTLGGLARADLVFGGHRYFMTPTPMGWTQAEAWAESRGGTLVCINNANENAALVQYFLVNNSNRWMWIGLTDQAVEGSFQWATGEPLAYTRWLAGEPNNYPGLPHSEDFVAMEISGWSDFGIGGDPYMYYGVVETTDPPPSPPCHADVVSTGGDPIRDGVVTVDDLVAFLTAFFGQTALVADVISPGGGYPDGAVTVDDLVQYMTMFFAGCP